MTQHLKCDLKFFRQNLYTSSAGFSPLPCCFWPKLLDVYEIGVGVAPNFKFKFCNYLLFVMWCYVRNNYCQICGKGASWAPKNW